MSAETNARRASGLKVRTLCNLLSLCSICVCCAVLCTCSEPAGPGSKSPGHGPQAILGEAGKAGQVSAPFDVGAVMRQVHFAFRPGDQGRFSGGHSTYSVEVSSSMAMTLVPALHPPDKGGEDDPGALSGAAPHPDPDRHPQNQQGAAVIRGAAITLATAQARRGQTPVHRGAGQPRVDRDGALIQEWEGMVERLKNTADGVERSWAFARRPGGSGDLEIKVRVKGLEYAGPSSQGLHFVDPKTKIGVRYGWATWIGANKERTAIRGAFIRGHVVLRVPSAVLESSAYPAILDPLISPEFGVDKPLSGPAWAGQQFPSVAHDGTDYLVVWQDYRSSQNSSWDIYGARVNAAGNVQNPGGIIISDAYGNQYRPSVAHDGSQYLVTWYDHRNGSYADIFGARVTTAGAVLDPTGFAISTASYHQYYPEVAFGGGHFLVVWQDYRNGAKYADIYGARVSSKGVPLDKLGILISNATNHQVAPSVAYDGTNFLVVWSDYRTNYSPTYTDIYGARVSLTGTVLDKAGIPISTAAQNQHSPSVSYNANGTNYLVVWHDYRNRYTTSYDIYGARLSPDGKVKDPAGIPISTDKGQQSSPAVAHDGTNFLVVWEDYRQGSTTDIYGARIDATGTVLDKTGIAVSSAANHQRYAAIARGKASFLVVWEDHRNATNVRSDIYGALVNSAGTVLIPGGVLISSAANDQYSPAVAYDGTNFLAVWQDYRDFKGSYYDIYGALVSPLGKIISSGIAVSTANGNQRFPEVAYGGGKYLVVWEDSRSGTDIYGAMVDTKGKVLHPTGVTISNAANSQIAPSVAYDGTNFLVVWQDYRSSTSHPDIYGVLVNKFGGVASSAGVPISTASYSQGVPSVAYGVGSFLVVWEDYRNYTSSSWDIYGARVSTAGVVLDSAGIAISTQYSQQRNPSVAHDGTNFLMVWEDYRNSAKSHWDIYGARMSSAGNLLNNTDIPISTAAMNQRRSRVASDASGALAVWEDYRNGTYNPDVYGTTLTAAGKVDYGLGFPITTSSGQDKSPNLVSSASGSFMVVYSQFNPQGTSGAFRIMGRTVSAKKKDGTTCTTGSECKSGFCVDGVCCDTACGGGNTSDCQACSVSAGAKTDGICGAAKAGGVCRGMAGSCDVPETCDGTSMVCPTQTYKSSGAACRGALDLCDAAETCTGSSAICPQDTFKTSGATCRPAAGLCDLSETCTGLSIGCPQDGFKAPSTVCRTAAGECDVEEKCPGTSGLCPGDVFKADKTPCQGGSGACVAGKCITNPDAGAPPDLGQDAVMEGGVDAGTTNVDAAAEGTMTPDSAAEAGPDPGPDQGTGVPPTEEGCSCRIGQPASLGGAGAPITLLLLAAFGLWRRRREPPTSPPC